MNTQPIAQALHMSLNDSQREMRENIGNKSYWEKRWLDDSDSVCADLMALYMVTGEETRTLIIEMMGDLFEKFKEEIIASRDEREEYYMEVLERAMAKVGAKVTKEVMSAVNERFGYLESKVVGLEHNDRRQDSRIDKLEHQNTNMSIKIDHVEAYTKHIPTLSESLNKLHGTVNLALAEASKPEQSKPEKSSIWSKVPIQFWVALAAGISGALVYVFTGDVVNFGFGGGK